MSVFSTRVQSEMEKSGLGQKELAAKTGITAATISRYLPGKMRPSGENVKAIATVLGVTTDYLLGSSDEPYPSNKIKLIYDSPEARELILDLLKDPEFGEIYQIWRNIPDKNKKLCKDMLEHMEASKKEKQES